MATSFGAASCSEGVPEGRKADVTCRNDVEGVPVTVNTALGVGGAKPPVIPAVLYDQFEMTVQVKDRLTVLEAKREFGRCHCVWVSTLGGGGLQKRIDAYVGRRAALISGMAQAWLCLRLYPQRVSKNESRVRVIMASP